MLGPYRVPGPVEPDSLLAPSEVRCSAVRVLGCGAMPPAPPRFPASIGGVVLPAPAPARRVPASLLKALTAAATLLLLVASASLAAIASSLVIAELSVVGAPRRGRALALEAPQQQVQSATLVQAGADLTPGGSLAAMGPETHAVDELWRRAARLAREGADVTLVRTSLPEAATTDWTRWSSYLRVQPEQRGAAPGGVRGLRITGLDGESAPALAGVRRGDVITAVNGYALGSPEESLRAFAGAGEARTLVAELERDGRRIALRVDWKG